MQKTKHLIKYLSNNTTKTSQNWRTQITHKHLVSQISSILEQRHNWPSILQTLNLKSKLTPSIFLQILNTTQIPPQISLNFFKWAIKNTSFQPDISIQCRMTHLLIGSGLVNPSKPILDSLLQNNPPAQIAQLLISSCGKDRSFCGLESLRVFDCVIDWYCDKGLCVQALEVFNLTRDLVKYSSRSCHTLLNVLYEKDEVRLCLCFYGVMIRNGGLIDPFTLRVIAKVFNKQGKVDAMLRLISVGVNDPLIYDLVIDCCCEMGKFEVALQLFDEMSKRKLNPGFNAFASLLNGACRYKNDEMIKFAMEAMAEKGYVSKALTDHDSIIQKVCDMRKTYAADMLFKTACGAQKSLENKTYGCMIRAFSMDTCVKEAIEVYHIIEQRTVKVDPVFYSDFINILCNENASKEADNLLKDLISKAYKPSPTALSKYITTQCKKRRWKEAEELSELALQQSIVLESSCCGLLVKRYCMRGQIDLAVKLHDQMEKKDYSIDTTACNALITGLLQAARVKEAERLFDSMRIKNLLTSESFVIMINGFCRENKLRKAMTLHDEMLERGLKPSPKVYKRLICNFK